MTPDAYIILIEVPEPVRPGHPSMPELRDRILAAINAAYIEGGERIPPVNLLFWRGELMSAKRSTI